MNTLKTHEEDMMVVLHCIMGIGSFHPVSYAGPFYHAFESTSS